MKISVICPYCRKKTDSEEIESVYEKVENIDGSDITICSFHSGAHIYCSYCNKILSLVIAEHPWNKNYGLMVSY